MSLTILLQDAGYVIVFLLMISVLVAAHELGHYLFARMFNMGVEEFAIGFGKQPILTWMRRRYVVPIRPGDDPDHRPRGGASHDPAALASALEGGGAPREIERIETPQGPALRETTEFTIRPWPLGGFVRIKGMLPEEDGSETRIPGGFYSKPPWQRFLVLFAGPLFSVLAGVIVLIPVLMFEGKDVQINKPVIGQIVKGKSAELAGLQPGDHITSIDGKTVSTYYDMVLAVRNSAGRTMNFALTRDNHPLVIAVKPYLDPNPGPLMGPDLQPTTTIATSYRIGAYATTRTIPMSFGAALADASKVPYMMVQNVLQLFTTPKEFSDNVAGPATMVQATASAVQHGFWNVLFLASMLSISVGIFNLLPAHPLDGGQMVMALAEMFRGGRRLSIRTQVIAGGIGMTFVAALVLCVFVVDIRRIVSGNSAGSSAPASNSAPAKK